jgi:KDO2-lipid IV(A) lauroyltransferase
MSERSLPNTIRKNPAVRKARRYLVYLFSLTGCFVARHLSWPSLVKIGRFFGRFAFRTVKWQRKRTMENLGRVFAGEKQEEELLRIAERVYENFGITSFEFPKMAAMTDAEFWNVCLYEPEQIDYLRSLLKKGKGIIFASAHMGDWEMLAEFGARLGFDMSVLYKPNSNPYINKIWLGLRRHNRLIDITRDLSAVVRRLRENKVISLLFDENARNAGIEIPFFGRPVSTYKGPAFFSLRSGCPIVCLYFVRQDDGRLRFIIERTIWPERKGPLDEDIVRIMQEMNLSLELTLRKHPEQWYWFYKRWRTTT